MFEPLRDALRGFSTRLDPDERRTATQAMRDALVHAKLGLNDLRASLASTNARLASERAELETVRRRQGLAAQIHDEETVAIAERFAVQHQERVAMLETKQMVQQHELSLAERDYEEMAGELRMILSGVAPGARSNTTAAREPMAPDDMSAGTSFEHGGAADIDSELDDPMLDPISDSMSATDADPTNAPTRRTRAEREADAEQRLAALKRRMGK
ncbi:hypothetical protein [Gemmatimonas groenlandica]|uniref:PspA/IM30 family protein n=1 Tax=Gemmatimonas groenlandica TaxID=2732249 RepID=A0A6M4IPX9_9BACT|nr:hypothetical protein [Gemmatimonas groenlandica]QJR36028.1 hypothetical protein HKW67_11165 [Gemmatimonas groenlandica]